MAKFPPEVTDPRFVAAYLKEVEAARAESRRAAIEATYVGRARLERKRAELLAPPPPKRSATPPPEPPQKDDDFTRAAARLQARQDEAVAYELRRLKRQWDREDAALEKRLQIERNKILKAKALKILADTKHIADLVARRRRRGER